MLSATEKGSAIVLIDIAQSQGSPQKDQTDEVNEEHAPIDPGSLAVMLP